MTDEASASAGIARADPIEVGRIPRGNREEWRASVETNGNHCWLELRLWHRSKGILEPTRTTVLFPAAQIPALRQAIEAAEQAISSHGG